MQPGRISTGIPGLNEVLNGGFIPASSYLILGSPGAGKTVFSLQFLRECRDNGGNCLYLSLSESVKRIKRNAKGFNWRLRDINLIEMIHNGETLKNNGEYSIFPPSEVEEESIWKRIYNALDRFCPKGLVIDSVTNLKYLSTNDYLYRKHIQRLIRYLLDRDCLSLLIYEPTELEKDQSIATEVDGIFWIHREISTEKVIEIRSIEVVKFRGSGYLSGRHSMRISSSGIKVYPHRIEKIKQPGHKNKTINSGIEALDKLLKGGLHVGSCTLITGPSGVGKSTLSSHFLAHAASNGIKSSMYCFEEGKQSIIDRCDNIGIPLKKWIDKGGINIVEINPLSLCPDEFLALIRKDVEDRGCEFLILDSLRGYSLAMAEYGNIIANLQNILNYLRGKGISLFLINEMQRVVGDFSISEDGVSYLSDNILLLRYAEYNGELIKVIACLKKRHGDFESDLREIKITSSGVKVGEKLTRLRGLLTGVPKAEDIREKPDF